MANTWDIEGLRTELSRYREELVAAGKVPNTVQTYVDRADRFIRWLAGEYDPAQERGSVRSRLDTGTRAARSHHG